MNRFIVEEQHGFTPGRSTTSNLAIFNDYLSTSIDRGDQVDVIYMDFCKAFDKVDHAALLSKLKQHEIDGPILAWIESYLSERS